MSRKSIKKLAQESFTHGELDENKVGLISPKLKRRDLKIYIRFIKEFEKQHTVYVFIPANALDTSKETLMILKKYFDGEKIIISVDEQLLTGIRVINNDNVFELSLNKTFDDIATFVENQYGQ